MVELKPIQKEDLPFVLEIRNDISTRKWLGNNTVFSLEDAERWLEHDKPKWFIVYMDSLKVGYIRTGDESNRSIWIGCDIHPALRSGGFGYRALTSAINKFYFLGINHFFLEVFDENEIAKRLYKKLGFKEVSRRVIDGKEYIKMEKKV